VIDTYVGYGGLAGLILGLFAVYRGLRADSNRRFDRYTDTLEQRFAKVERRLARYQQRVYQLEAILRANGIQVPPWTATPDDIDELGADLHPYHKGDLS